MFSLARSRKSSNTVSRVVGADGYRQCDRAIVCTFQAIVEHEPDCDYSALSAALKRARDPQFVVTLVNLRAAYNDGVYAAAQYAYSNR